MAKSAILHIRIAPELLALLRAAAKRDGVSTTAIVERFIRDGFEREARRSALDRLVADAQAMGEYDTAPRVAEMTMAEARRARFERLQK